MTATNFGASRSLRLEVGPVANHLLGALPAEEWRYWQAHLESVELCAGTVLYGAGTELRHMYFPTTATISLCQFTENGASTEFAVVGNDGAVGIALFLGGRTTPGYAAVQTSGHGFRIAASALRERFARSADVKHLMLRYTQSVLVQMAQTAACNRHHSIEPQLCRWLLMRLDRLSGGEIRVTQQMIATLLGVRRESVTGVTRQLQRAGLIESARGCMRVLNRSGLEARACECYAAMKRESDRLLPRQPARPSHRRKKRQVRSMGLLAPGAVDRRA